MFKIRTLLIGFSILVLSLQSCSEYNKVLKADDYIKKFDLANKLYDNNKFARCIALYEQVYQKVPRGSQGEMAYYRIGKSYYNEKDWYMGSYYLAGFTSRYPYSSLNEECTFLAALCAVQKSPEATLDQNDTELALNELQKFVGSYPKSKYIDTCNKIMDNLRFKLETKDILNVRLYAKTENYRAATVAAEQFLENYPISAYREEASVLLLRSSYILTVNSIAEKIAERREKTKERYRNFLAEFPKSSYLREFNNYIEKLDAINAAATTN